MTRQGNGDFLLELALDAGKEYEFRCVIDGGPVGERLERRQVRVEGLRPM
jgi:hypothetical protein